MASALFNMFLVQMKILYKILQLSINLWDAPKSTISTF